MNDEVERIAAQSALKTLLDGPATLRPKRPCDQCKSREAQHEFSFYQRSGLIVVWRGEICNECFDNARALLKKSGGSTHLILILPLSFPRRVPLDAPPSL